MKKKLIIIVFTLLFVCLPSCLSWAFLDSSVSPTIKNSVIADNEREVLINSGNLLLDYNHILGYVGTQDCPYGDYCGVTPGPHDKSQDPRFWSP